MKNTEPEGPAGLGEALAERVRLERTNRGWSYDRLSKELAGVRCRVAPSSLHKIERGTPRRSISVDELFALAKVFDTDVLALAQSASAHFSERASTLLERHARAAETFVEARLEDHRTVSELHKASQHLEGTERERIVRDWVRHAALTQGMFKDSRAFEDELVDFLDPATSAESPFAAAIDGDAIEVPGYKYHVEPGTEDGTGIRIQDSPGF
jgi:transcriptional regulator with XRE-family HTH domain